MELEQQEKSHVWWKATLKGALKGLLVGMALGAATAVLLNFAILPLLAPLAPGIGAAFSGWLSLTTAAGTSFSMLPIAIFSGLTGMLGGLVTSGATALSEYHLQKHFDLQQLQEAKLIQLESREQRLEQQLGHASPGIKSIVARGPRASFADEQLERAQNAPTSPTIH